ncbi:DNA polymerase delta subunit 2-like protein [Leptotrombidium deliense]|uniref:DNA polymerase delta subunit 2-like protein n=1 Tax=Leptotrombidium deliense TaxID=299467 RepID=A0A443SSJ3_9ACAR|nr:DNA polymerase delta subunit 2-like protein [Leptotrombidium deliense]
MEVERCTSRFQDLCSRFLVDEKSFTIQYYAYYNARLKLMYPWLEASARNKWGKDVTIVSLSDLTTKSGEKVCVIGTLFKRMDLQPTILKELSEEHQLIPQPLMEKYTSEEDVLYLQDNRESVRLMGTLNVKSFVTGISVALLGYEDDDGNNFIVEDYCLPIFLDYVERPLTISGDKYVAIISDIGFSLRSNVNLISARNMFRDFVTGNTHFKINEDKAGKIVKVIVAGNCVSREVRILEQQENQKNLLSWNKKVRPFTLEIMQMIDNFLVTLGKFVDVDVMPGNHDVTSGMLPQQPIHPCLLPKSSVFESVRCVTNPYSAKFDNVLFLGTSGQNVDSIRQYSSYDDTLEIMEKTLLWRHIAPTAPDTLQSYPFADKDPFVLHECPHVYFAGNQTTFNTKLHKGPNGQLTRIIAVPQFESSFNCILVNLRNLDCELVAFG